MPDEAYAHVGRPEVVFSIKGGKTNKVPSPNRP